MTVWRPLLRGEEAALAIGLAGEIAADLRRRAASAEAAAPLPMGRARFALAGGWAGQALFFAYLDRALPGQGHDETAVDLLERAFDELGRADAQAGLFAGFTGLAWTVEHLRGWLVDEEDDPAEEIAERLARLLGARPWPLEYDLVSGLVGFGVHALERLPRPPAREAAGRAVAALAGLAERGPAGLSWWTDHAVMPKEMHMGEGAGHYNLGVSHGVPGVLGWLGQACAAGVEGARPLLETAVPWLLAHQNPPRFASRFPSFTAPEQEGETSRLAWCYGDLGIAAALMTAARGAGEREWERAALEIARAAAARPLETADVNEPGLCHGAAGNLHLFNRLHQATGAPELAVAARVWFHRLLDMRQPGEGLGGFLVLLPDENRHRAWRADPGFLTGSAGIGLALLAAATPVEPAWDRLLLASARPVEGGYRETEPENPLTSSLRQPTE